MSCKHEYQQMAISGNWGCLGMLNMSVVLPEGAIPNLMWGMASSHMAAWQQLGWFGTACRQVTYYIQPIA